MTTKTASFAFLSNTGDANSSNDPWDSILLESENFVAIPTLGALVEGWLLIVPREKSLCIGALSEPIFAEFLEFKDRVAALVNECYGPAFFFEHGPSHQSQSVGCGVDHAHLHVVPCKDEVFSWGLGHETVLTWAPIDSIEGLIEVHNKGLAYLYLERPDGSAVVATGADLPSQYFRRMIASHLGIPDQFNWRDFPMCDNVMHTIRQVRAMAPKSLG